MSNINISKPSERVTARPCRRILRVTPYILSISRESEPYLDLVQNMVRTFGVKQRRISDCLDMLGPNYLGLINWSKPKKESKVELTNKGKYALSLIIDKNMNGFYKFLITTMLEIRIGLDLFIEYIKDIKSFNSQKKLISGFAITYKEMGANQVNVETFLGIVLYTGILTESNGTYIYNQEKASYYELDESFNQKEEWSYNILLDVLLTKFRENADVPIPYGKQMKKSIEYSKISEICLAHLPILPDGKKQFDEQFNKLRVANPSLIEIKSIPGDKLIILHSFLPNDYRRP